MGYVFPMPIPRKLTFSRRFLLRCMAALAALGLIGAQPEVQAGGGPEKSILVIETATGRHEFSVEIVRSPADQTRGLMFRRRLAVDAGMLFLYSANQQVTMWMRNTMIPLDIIFISADGRIVNIAERAVPMSLRSIPSDGPVRAVLEVNGGTASRLRIVPGNRVEHPAFPPST